MTVTRTIANSVPTPADFLRAGWNLARREPMIFAARFCAEGLAMALRLTALFLLGLLVVVHLGNHVARGGTLMQWFPLGLERFTSPSVLAAVAGLLLASWAVSFAGHCIAGAGIYGTLADGVQDREVRRWRSALRAIPRGFSDAVAVRVLTSTVNLTLVTVGIGMFLGVGQLARGAEVASGSGVVVPAAAWAFAAAMYALSAGLVRLTAEMVAAPVFLERRGLGDAIISAASLVASRPVLVYRIFVQSASVLIAPLFLYWVALFGQQLSIGTPGLAAVGELLVLVADVVLLAGLAAFAVMVQASFFACYAWDAGLLVLASSKAKPRKSKAAGSLAAAPTLEDILPVKWPNVFDVDAVLGPWDADDLEPRPPSPDQRPPTASEFDLDAILDDSEGDGKA